MSASILLMMQIIRILNWSCPEFVPTKVEEVQIGYRFADEIAEVLHGIIILEILITLPSLWLNFPWIANLLLLSKQKWKLFGWKWILSNLCSLSIWLNNMQNNGIESQTLYLSMINVFCLSSQEFWLDAAIPIIANPWWGTQKDNRMEMTNLNE